MKLLVLCHSKVAYMIPDKLFEAVKKADIEYDEERQIEEPVKLLKMIRDKYKPISIGYLLTGDLG